MTPIEQIKIYGYCKLNQVYFPDEVMKMLSLVKKLDLELPKIPDEYTPRLNKTSKNIYNLHTKDKFFIDMLFKSDTIEQILIHFLNDPYYKQIPANLPNYILRHMGCRSSEEELPPHIDSFFPYPGNKVIAMQMFIYLEDSTEKNGCTVIWPGSHIIGEYASENSKKKFIPVEAKAGDVVLMDGRCHHGTLANMSTRTRWTIASTFTRYWIKQMFRITDDLPKEIYDQITPKQKAILGFSSIPFLNESFGIDMKNGYL